MNKHKITQKVKNLYYRLPLWTWIVVGVLLLWAIIYALIFAIPKQATLSYAGETCVRQFVLIPNIYKQAEGSHYTVQVKDLISVGKYQLIGTSVCFIPTNSPVEGTDVVSAAPFGGWFGTTLFNITVPSAPVANTKNFIDSTIPTTRPLEISLSEKDKIFDYKLATAEDSTKCQYGDDALECDIPALALKQGKSYEVTLERHFNNKHVETLAKGAMTTLSPLNQVEGSVGERQVIYEKPTGFTFVYDKQLEKGEVSLKKQVGDIWETIPTKVSLKATSLIINLEAELPRKTQYELTIQQAEAKDGSALDGPTIVHFSTSGGPKVTGVTIPTYGIAQSGTITVTLDQEVANITKLAELVTVRGANAQVSKKGNTLRINYSDAAFCDKITLSVKRGLESVSGVASDEDWVYNSQTICHTTRVIGTSTQGRAILAYTYGSGSKTILYTGSIHGNEHSSRLLMNSWMNELEINPGNIPAGTRIIVIPSLNPDGQLADSRYNARNVDLNRNFDVSDWKKDIQTVNGQPFPDGGGEKPESEVETKVLVAFTKEVAPYLTMSYHATGAYAIGNGCGSSAILAAKYAQLSGYRNMTGNSGAFSYEITGTYDDWLCEKLGSQSVLIELATSSSAEFARNKLALWQMARS